MINENSLLDYVRDLIKANEADLFDGIVQQSQQRGFAHITQTSLTPPTGYYFLAMEVKGVQPYTILNALDIDMVLPHYTVEIVVVDYISPVNSETELYESQARDFRTVTNRLYNLLDSHPFSGQWRRPDQFNLTMQNQPVGYEDVQYYAYCTSTLSFVIQGC